MTKEPEEEDGADGKDEDAGDICNPMTVTRVPVQDLAVGALVVR
jgi:hypothetical protein